MSQAPDHEPPNGHNLLRKLQWERDYWRRRAGKFVAACDRLADENGRLRTALAGKHAFELAIVCLMRRLNRRDRYRSVAARLLARHGTLVPRPRTQE